MGTKFNIYQNDNDIFFSFSVLRKHGTKREIFSRCHGRKTIALYQYWKEPFNSIYVSCTMPFTNYDEDVDMIAVYFECLQNAAAQRT